MKGALSLTETERAVCGDVVGGDLQRRNEVVRRRIVADLFLV